MSKRSNAGAAIKFSCCTVALVASLLIAGCASNTAPQPVWLTTMSTDQFSDQTTCTVTVGSIYTRGSALDLNNSFYPYVSKVGTEVRVGVRSGGQYRLPVGDVQLRIDQNPAITLSTADTPIDSQPAQAVPAIPQGLTPEQQKLVQATYTSALAATTKATSPYTAAVGAKALELLNQMKAGKVLIYRRVGLNQPASTTGQAALDRSFADGLAKCGIN